MAARPPSVKRCRACGCLLRVTKTVEVRMDPMRILTVRRRRECPQCPRVEYTREVLEGDLQRLIDDSLALLRRPKQET